MDLGTGIGTAGACLSLTGLITAYLNFLLKSKKSSSAKSSSAPQDPCTNCVSQEACQHSMGRLEDYLKRIEKKLDSLSKKIEEQERMIAESGQVLAEYRQRIYANEESLRSLRERALKEKA